MTHYLRTSYLGKSSSSVAPGAVFERGLGLRRAYILVANLATVGPIRIYRPIIILARILLYPLLILSLMTRVRFGIFLFFVDDLWVMVLHSVESSGCLY